MKVAFISWSGYGNVDMKNAFLELGHEVIDVIACQDKGSIDNKDVSEYVKQIESKQIDFIFSFNYWPGVSLAAKECDLPYISWVYDSPHVAMYSYTIIYEKNYVFCFDREVVREFRTAGINTVYYLPLAANVTRLEELDDFGSFSKTSYYPQKPVSFVGSLYTTTHGDNPFFNRLIGINEYTRGYLDGLMKAQQKVYGLNFIQKSLKDDIVDEMRRVLPMTPNARGVESVEYLFAQYVINRQITQMDRLEIIKSVSDIFGMDLYSWDRDYETPGLVNHGPVDYYDKAPYVFKLSKINLNITLRSIFSAVPLRAFEIMGSGGFLLTNYQADFNDLFVADEDYVYYESMEDLIYKIEYYLNNDRKRKEIAYNGFIKVKENHNYIQRINEIFSIVFG